MKKAEIVLISGEETFLLCMKLNSLLPEYFGLPECNTQYAEGVKTCINFTGSERLL